MNALRCYSQFYDQYNIIIQSFNGEITLDLLKSFKRKELQKEGFARPINILCDIRGLKISSLVNETTDFISFSMENGELYIKRKSAVLVKNASQHVYASLFSTSTKDMPNQIKVFTNISEALNWLGISLNSDEAEELLIEVKKQSAIFS